MCRFLNLKNLTCRFRFLVVQNVVVVRKDVEARRDAEEYVAHVLPVAV